MKKALWIFIIALIIFLLSACSSRGVTRPLDIDKDLLQDCPEIQAMKGEGPTLDEEVLGAYVELLTKYADCAIHKRKLNDEIRKAM